MAGPHPPEEVTVLLELCVKGFYSIESLCL